MTKFIVNAKTLLTALMIVSKAIEKRALVPIIESYLFQVTGNRLTISGTDLQTTFKVALQVECKSIVNFAAVVPPTIVKYLQKLGDTLISFYWHAESYSIELLDDSNARAKYSGENPEDFTKEPICDEILYYLNSSSFIEFKDLLNYASSDQLRPAMTGIYFGSHNGQYNLCATDGHRLKTVTLPELSQGPDSEKIQAYTIACERYREIDRFYWDNWDNEETRETNDKLRTDAKEICDRLKNELDRQDYILPAKPAKILSDLKAKELPLAIEVRVKRDAAENIENVAFSFAYMGFDCELISRAIDEKFPDYWNIIPNQDQTKTSYTVDKKSFLKTLDKALLFANKTTHQIRLSLNGANKMSAEDLDFSNEFCAEIGSTYKGDPIEIGFNGQFLAEVCASFGDSFELELIAPNKAGIIRQGNALALLMPVMLCQYEAPTAEELAKELTQARQEAREDGTNI